MIQTWVLETWDFYAVNYLVVMLKCFMQLLLILGY